MFETVFKHFYKTSYGMIYPTLRRLSNEGLVEKEVVIQEGKPNKNVYHITEKGKKAFAEYLKTPISPEKRESEFLVRMYFGSNEDEQTIASWIENELAALEKNIEQLESDHKVWCEKMTTTQEITYEIGLAQFKVAKEILQKKLSKLTEC